MPNYKNAQALSSLDINGYVHPMKTGDLLIHLKKNNSAAVPKTLELNLVDYQVPSGRKLTLFYMKDLIGTGTDMDLCTTTAVDATTGKVIIIPAGATSINHTNLYIYEVAENLYVTRDSAQATSSNTELYGIETDK